MNEAFISYVADILGDTNNGLTGSQIVRYSVKYAVEYNVEIIYSTYPFGNYITKRTALKKNILCFNDVQRYAIIWELCNLSMFKNKEDIEDLKIILQSRYGHLAITKVGDTELVQKTQHWLADYSGALELYNAALAKYDNDLFQRNTLDDIRLSFELLLKEVLNNSKSLENQISEIGGVLREKEVSNELRNMINRVINYYTKYQNTYVKHDDNVNENEIEYIIELTSIIMKFIIKITK